MGSLFHNEQSGNKRYLYSCLLCRCLSSWDSSGNCCSKWNTIYSFCRLRSHAPKRFHPCELESTEHECSLSWNKCLLMFVHFVLFVASLMMRTKHGIRLWDTWVFKAPLLSRVLYQTVSFPETENLLVGHSVSRALQTCICICYGMSISLCRESLSSCQNTAPCQGIAFNGTTWFRFSFPLCSVLLEQNKAFGQQALGQSSNSCRYHKYRAWQAVDTLWAPSKWLSWDYQMMPAPKSMPVPNCVLMLPASPFSWSWEQADRFKGSSSCNADFPFTDWQLSIYRIGNLRQGNILASYLK